MARQELNAAPGPSAYAAVGWKRFVEAVALVLVPTLLAVGRVSSTDRRSPTFRAELHHTAFRIGAKEEVDGHAAPSTNPQTA